MQVNLELYRVFVMVAEKNSFTRAGEELHLTQSAVSQAVRQLENALGVQLFIRSSRGAVLSKDGQTLLEVVGGILPAAARAEHYFTQVRGLEKGVLKIGASDTLCRHVLLDTLKEFHTLYPGVEIQVTNRTSGETAGLVRKGEADMGFINLPTRGLEGLAVTKLAPVHDCFVCGSQYFEDFTAAVPLARLREYPVLMLEHLSSSRQYLDGWLEEQGMALAPQIELGSLDLLVEFAAANLGIAAVTREYVGDAVAQGRLRVLRLQEKIPPRHIGLICLKEHLISHAGRAFLQLLQKEDAPAAP